MSNQNEKIITQIWAHRGASKHYVENTLPAFAEAIALGSEGVELDVQQTADGRIIVFHDESLKRLAGLDKYVPELKWAEIKSLPLVDSALPNVEGTVPLLEEVLSLLKSTNLTVNIEFKNSIFLYQGMEDSVLDLVRHLEMEDSVVYSSFNHKSIQRLAASGKVPAERLGLLSADLAFEPWDYLKACGAGLYHPLFNSLHDDDLTSQLRQRGMKINMWTIDEPRYIRAALEAGVDAIITNVPDVALAVRHQLEH